MTCGRRNTETIKRNCWRYVSTAIRKCKLVPCSQDTSVGQWILPFPCIFFFFFFAIKRNMHTLSLISCTLQCKLGVFYTIRERSSQSLVQWLQQSLHTVWFCFCFVFLLVRISTKNERFVPRFLGEYYFAIWGGTDCKQKLYRMKCRTILFCKRDPKDHTLVCALCCLWDKVDVQIDLFCITSIRLNMSVCLQVSHYSLRSLSYFVFCFVLLLRKCLIENFM